MDYTRVGLVGCGIAGRDLHIPSIQQLEGAELVALCDQDQNRLNQTLPGEAPNRYQDVAEMLSQESLDVVHVATPPQSHWPIAERLLKEDVHTVIEKPLTASIEHAEKLVAAEEDSDAIGTVIHNQLFFPQIQYALDTIESGSVGDVVSVTMLFGDRRNLSESERGDWVFDLPGGEIGEGLPHQAYLPLAFVDRLGNVENVSKYKSVADENVDFDSVTIEASDSTGSRSITIKVQTRSVFQNMLHIHCEDAEFQIELTNRYTYLNKMTNVSIPELVIQNLSHLFQLTKSNLDTALSTGLRISKRAMGRQNVGEYGVGHYNQLKKFYQAVENDGRSPVTFSEGLDTVRILESLDT